MRKNFIEILILFRNFECSDFNIYVCISFIFVLFTRKCHMIRHSRHQPFLDVAITEYNNVQFSVCASQYSIMQYNFSDNYCRSFTCTYTCQESQVKNKYSYAFYHVTNSHRNLISLLFFLHYLLHRFLCQINLNKLFTKVLIAYTVEDGIGSDSTVIQWGITLEQVRLQ